MLTLSMRQIVESPQSKQYGSILRATFGQAWANNEPLALSDVMAAVGWNAAMELARHAHAEHAPFREFSLQILRDTEFLIKDSSGFGDYRRHMSIVEMYWAGMASDDDLRLAHEGLLDMSRFYRCDAENYALFQMALAGSSVAVSDVSHWSVAHYCSVGMEYLLTIMNERADINIQEFHGLVARRLNAAFSCEPDPDFETCDFQSARPRDLRTAA